MIQVQNSRFIYNWRKLDGHYPSYNNTKPEFEGALRQFLDFLDEAKLGTMSLNQWEITYINHIPKGPLWGSPEEWHRIVPEILLPISQRDVALTRFENVTGEWHHEIVPQLGRLHVAL